MKRNCLGLVFVAAALVFSVLVFKRLPDRVATHFDVHGQADGWSSRTVAAFVFPLFGVLMVGIFNVLPRILPRRENFVHFEDSYWLVANLIVAFVCALNAVLLARAIGWPVDVPTAALLGIGALFVVLGTVLPRTRSNWFLGIRTPWTLDNEEVWRETHQLGGRTFIIGGVITMIAAFMPSHLQPWIAIGALAIGAFVPVIYSYFVWRRVRRS